MGPIEKMRSDLGLTRAELAIAVGINYSDVRAAEGGLVQTPHRNLMAFAEARGTTREQFLTEHRRFLQERRAVILSRTP